MLLWKLNLQFRCDDVGKLHKMLHFLEFAFPFAVTLVPFVSHLILIRFSGEREKKHSILVY